MIIDSWKEEGKEGKKEKVSPTQKKEKSFENVNEKIGAGKFKSQMTFSLSFSVLLRLTRMNCPLYLYLLTGQ